MNKTAVVVLSDPKAQAEESLSRIYNALAVAYDFKSAGHEVKILFQGTGTRWPEYLLKDDHPAHSLYKSLESTVEGISRGCAEVFGADSSGLDLIYDNDVPGTSGLPSFVRLENDGFRIFIF